MSHNPLLASQQRQLLDYLDMRLQGELNCNHPGLLRSRLTPEGRQLFGRLIVQVDTSKVGAWSRLRVTYLRPAHAGRVFIVPWVQALLRSLCSKELYKTERGWVGYKLGRPSGAYVRFVCMHQHEVLGHVPQSLDDLRRMFKVFANLYNGFDEVLPHTLIGQAGSPELRHVLA
jgi:hypothetical protein